MGILVAVTNTIGQQRELLQGVPRAYGPENTEEGHIEENMKILSHKHTPSN